MVRCFQEDLQQYAYYCPSRRWRTLLTGSLAKGVGRRFGSTTEAKRARIKAIAEHGPLGFEIIEVPRHDG